MGYDNQLSKCLYIHDYIVNPLASHSNWYTSFCLPYYECLIGKLVDLNV